MVNKTIRLGIFQEEINKAKNARFLYYTRIPWLLWITGILLLGLGIFLLIYIAPGKFSAVVDKSKQKKWWQYFIAIILILVSFFVLYLGRVKTIRLDKDV